MKNKDVRISTAPWFNPRQRPPVIVAGAGGIGSWLTLLLNRAGFETYVFDFDVYEEANMAGQFVRRKGVGMTKVDALAEVIREFCDEEIIPNFEKITMDSPTNEIVFSAFDNMEARKVLFGKWVAQYKGKAEAIFIDGRLTAEQITVFCIKGNDNAAIEEYEREHLFNDSEVEEISCTFKQTSHNAAFIAARMTQSFVNWYSERTGKEAGRAVPFFYLNFTPMDYQEIRYEAVSNAQCKEHNDKLASGLLSALSEADAQAQVGVEELREVGGLQVSNNLDEAESLPSTAHPDLLNFEAEVEFEDDSHEVELRPDDDLPF